MEEKSEANYHSSNSSSSSNSSADSNKNNIKILNNRLQVLEQESEKMRKVLVVCMDERRELISEILQLFQTLCTNCKGAITRPHLSFCQETRHRNLGLVQALSEDSNPLLVLRGSTTTKENILC
ncbi:hypothetical protein BVRB_9g221200 [Beta vulgaris subsp. vulgaris]|uniref:uncharacterized protein LOC104904705 n=1 Tax=Beta vulgaris subsp. vulgaris TaxID=3555 RepID=UPI00053F4EE3|nr:uncharacterized protein LOC104904705 [Beta vulgaris subsp. vulgaris]KMT00845.1 hypothetical protein BVRB_9g221200 [Beta vulgaris subsp. vulgaris]